MKYNLNVAERESVAEDVADMILDQLLEEEFVPDMLSDAVMQPVCSKLFRLYSYTFSITL